MSDRYEPSIKTILVLSKRYKSFTTHQRNIQSLAIELFMIKANLSNNIMNDIFRLEKLTAT